MRETVMVWIFNNTGKGVFAAALFHMIINLTWQLFPVNGSYYDPRISGLILAVVAVIVVAFWGPPSTPLRRTWMRPRERAAPLQLQTGRGRFLASARSGRGRAGLPCCESRREVEPSAGLCVRQK